MRDSVGAAWFWFWFFVVLDFGRGSFPVPDITEQSFIDRCVKEHKEARSSVRPAATDMKDMSWDDGLARVAKAWAQRCVFEHNSDRDADILAYSNISSVGENIWAGAPPSAFSVEGAMKVWLQEEEQYDYQSNSCSRECGHYTQVVWASSERLGCSAHLCSSGVRKTSFADKEGLIFVCNYGPSGNRDGMRPYVSAELPCSDCGGTSLRSTGSGYHPVTYSDLNYTVILIVRPLALIATLLAAYGVHHLYPNIFFYE